MLSGMSYEYALGLITRRLLILASLSYLAGRGLFEL